MMVKFKRHFVLAIIIAMGFNASAQMHERGKKNFFLEPEGSINFSNYIKSAFTGREFGTSFGMSGGKVFAGFIKAGIVYRYNQHKMESWSSNPIYSNYQYQTVGLKADLMVPFFRYYLGKSRKYECMGITNYLFLGPEFGFNFGGKGDHYFLNAPNFLLNVSWAMLFKKSGGNKKQAANDIYLAINMKKAFTAFVNQEINTQKFYATYWGLSIIWVRYKTGNWLR